ncbi:hypothetical protein [Pseudomonas sp. C11]|uniref:hypothetical protein n=1 Tax=Pseudomonas sp. C11 TaxID=3075550 RepID=UPI002AFDF060|nr:hypothetical protein [Pseudomonas sp. C11]
MEKHTLFLKKITSMHEDDFSRNIVIPLLRKIGYTYVDFHGGANEEGKDIIATKTNDFLETEVTVIQSKMLKTKRLSASSQKFSEIVHQLRLCLSKKIPCSDGHLRTPSKTILITPYEIDTRHLRDQFELISINEILVIDAPKLCSLLEKHWPEAFSEISTPVEQATTMIDGETKNLELHRALHIDSGTPYSEYYSDLSFFVGETESTTVLASEIISSFNGSQEHSKEEWDALIKLDEWLSHICETKLIIDPQEETEEAFKNKYKEHTNKENRTKILEYKRLHDQAQSRINTSQKIIIDLKKEVAATLTQKRSISTTQPSEIDDLENLFELINKAEIELTPTSGKQSLNSLRDIHKESPYINTNKKVSEALHKYLLNIDAAIDAEKQKKEIEHQIIPPPKYIARIDPDEVCKTINSEIKRISQTIEKLNNRELTTSETKKILDTINVLLRCIDNITKKSLCETVKFHLHNNRQNPKVMDISAHVLFDSGCNISVYGEAGAGKSTTLHVYAEKLYKNKGKHDEVLFIPLNRVTSKLGKLEPEHRERVLSGGSSLESLIGAFLLYKEIPPTPDNKQALIAHLKNKKKATIIIDALDEAANNATWIIKALSEIPRKISHAQVITSSRDCVKYLKEIEFLGITLLPFTKEQLKKFIFGWINSEERRVNLWENIQEKDIFEVARNPLLATIICSLHENGVPIPENEPEIYKSKIELLCGSYDQHKNIKRTSNSTSTLENCCRKIAYQMHRRKLRSAYRVDIEKYLSEGLNQRVSKTKITNLIDDLINTCNILKRTPDEETYGFGHLRYQEYLASEELSRTRSIDITALTNDNWWSGALYLYSFNNKIDPIIDEILQRHSSITPHQNNLLLMVKGQPKAAQAGLIALISRHVKLDSQEGKGPFGFWEDNHDTTDLSDVFDLIGVSRY